MGEQEVYIFEVSQSSFEQTVIQNSHKLPVFVVFMGVWSEPCFIMSDVLAKLATEFAGQLIFAKVDIDENAELREQYSIANVPTLKVFKNGEVLATEEGQLQEAELRVLLKQQGIFRQSDEDRMLAREKHLNGDTVGAITLLTQAIQQDPANTRIALDMVQIFLDIDELAQAQALFNKLPERDKESETGKALLGQLTIRGLAAKTEGKEALAQRVQQSSEDYDAHFDLAICYVAEHDYRAAMDHLFIIHANMPEYKEGAAREMIISLSNILAPNDAQLAQEFRRRLGSSMT